MYLILSLDHGSLVPLFLPVVMVPTSNDEEIFSNNLIINPVFIINPS